MASRVGDPSGLSVFVSGGSGSFGQAFVRRVLDLGARRVVVYSRDELKQAQMADVFKEDRLRFIVGDVRDEAPLLSAMDGCDWVVHAAAMKRIEVCEANPWEAVRTNIIGTHNVAQAAIRAGVEKAVFLSTDKAPAAHTLYGATKFAAERLWIQSNVFAAGKITRLAATRYGNVIGSRGSVVELWREQVAAGKVLTVTDDRFSRFWMTLSQAVDLVLWAFEDMRGGEIFVPKAPSSNVWDFAKAIGPHSAIRITGKRPGERLHETLISNEEAHTTYDAGTHYVIEPESRTWQQLPELPYPKVPEDFSYRSDTNEQWLGVDALREMVA